MHRRRMLFISRLICLISAFCAALSVYAQAPPCPTDNTDLKPRFISRLLSESANLDQCANGGVGDLPVVCTGKAWQNGNLCRNGAHYLEGESVPYRMMFSGLTPGNSYTVTIEWDTTENSGAKHALDYLTKFDETELFADPCSGVIGCNLAGKSDYAIPMDPLVAMGHDGIFGTIDDVVQKPGMFSLYGGAISAVSPYTMTGDYTGASQTRVTITFTAADASAVLAWGGHISTRVDWGVENSAIAINGAPYHMRLIDLNGAGGNQDRSLASDATVFPGTLTIIKEASPTSTQVFSFTSTGPGVADFSLVDNGTGIGKSQLFAGLTAFGAADSITVTEALSGGGYRLANVSCVELASGGAGQQNSTVDLLGRFANVILEEGEVVTCTFANQVISAAQASVSGRVMDTNGFPIRGLLRLTDLSTGTVIAARSGPFGYYQFDGLETGRVYFLEVSAKGYVFEIASTTISLKDNLIDVNFIGGRL